MAEAGFLLLLCLSLKACVVYLWLRVVEKTRACVRKSDH